MIVMYAAKDGWYDAGDVTGSWNSEHESTFYLVFLLVLD